jgi:hypothetical protein
LRTLSALPERTLIIYIEVKILRLEVPGANMVVALSERFGRYPGTWEAAGGARQARGRRGGAFQERLVANGGHGSP